LYVLAWLVRERESLSEARHQTDALISYTIIHIESR
jgi:hypothetical protein